MARVLALALLVLCGAASASDGVIEINQAVALADGVNGSLLADPQSFPVSITAAGSYRLTGNLDVRGATSPENVTAILVQANDVSVDLAGFAIYGSTVCTGTPPTTDLTCSPRRLGSGIDASSYRNASVFGGTVNGAGGSGVSCGPGFRIERMHVENSGGYGIAAASGSLVFGNIAHRNVVGISDLESKGLTIRGNSAVQNGFWGIRSGVSGVGLSLDSGVGYARNVIRLNSGGTVSGGVQLGPNLCDLVLCP